MNYDRPTAHDSPKPQRKPAARTQTARRAARGWEHAMAKDSPTPPTPPDPYQTANAQTQSNINTANYNAMLNRVNMVTPWGSLTYSHAGGTPGGPAAPTGGSSATTPSGPGGQYVQGDGGSYWVPGDGSGGGNSSSGGGSGQMMNPGTPDQWTGTVTLSPEQQHLLDLSNQTASAMGQTGLNQINAVQGMLSSPFDMSGAPQRVTNVGSGPLTSNVQFGNIQTNAPTPGQLTSSVAGAGQGLASHAGYGNIQNDVNMQGVQGVQGHLDTSNVPALIGGDALNADLQKTRDSLYNQQSAYLDPQWQQQQHDLQNTLVQQGVMQNSDAWNRAMDDFNRQRTFAYNQAQQSAITGGGAEQSRLFGLGLQANQNAFGQDLQSGQFANSAQAQQYQEALGNLQAHNAAQNQGFGQSLSNANLQNAAQQQGFQQNMQNAQLGNNAEQSTFAQQLAGMEAGNAAQNQGFQQGVANGQLNNSAQAQQFQQALANANLTDSQRQQYMQEMLAMRNQPLNELNALRSGSQVTAPNFPTAPQVNMPGTDIASLINGNYNNQMGAYNSQMSQQNAMMGGLFGLGQAGMMSGMFGGGGGAASVGLDPLLFAV